MHQDDTRAKLGTTGDVAKRLGARLIGDPHVALARLDSLDGTDACALSFVRDARNLTVWRESAVRAALIAESCAAEAESIVKQVPAKVAIVVKDADIAMVTLLELLEQTEDATSGIHAHATVHAEAAVDSTACVLARSVIQRGARVGARSRIGAGAVIGENVIIGRNSTIRSGVVIERNCQIGDHVILHPGVVIGADGFGYRPAPDGKSVLKIPHIGNVIIEDHVEVGANTTIDRAKFGSTRIGAGTKIDNLVQIGHNCSIGRSCIICGCCALAGSVRLGDGVTLAGGVAIADNRSIGAGATIGARSGVMDDVPPGEQWVGYPARPARQTLRIVAATEKLPDLIRELARAKPRD